MVEKHVQTKLQLLDLVCAQYVSGNLNDWSTVDVPAPQIEEEIAEVDRFLHCVKQYLEPFLRGNRGVSSMSLYETGHSIQTCEVKVMCLSEHSSMRMHARFQLFLV